MTIEKSVEPETAGLEPAAYADFGRAFFQHAITDERIRSVLAGILSGPIDVPQIGAGPGRLVKVAAQGTYGTVHVERTGSDPVEFLATIPVSVHFTLDLRVETHRFNAEVTIPIVLRAMPAAPLLIAFELIAPIPSELGVHVKAEGLRATVVQKVADIDHELRRFLARYVARELTKPYVDGARMIDIAALIDQSWTAGVGSE